MERMLAGKIALITGGGSGMGAATAQLFAAAGASVAIADIDATTRQAVVDTIAQAGGHAVPIHVDVADPADVARMLDTVVARFGRLDVAVNNAAVPPDTKPLVELEVSAWDRIVDINLKGVALCLKYELQQLVRQGTGGSIINVSSIRGVRGKANAAAYVASKHGVVGLTKVAAMEHGDDNIRVNCVAPGATDTPMLRASMARKALAGVEPSAVQNVLHRLGTAKEVAQASLWLASDLSSYVTGTTIHADGGATAD